METNAEKEKSVLLTVPEAAQEAGLTETAIRNAIYRGRLATTQMYGRVLIERGVFEEYRRNTKMGRPSGSKTRKQESTEAEG